MSGLSVFFGDGAESELGGEHEAFLDLDKKVGGFVLFAFSALLSGAFPIEAQEFLGDARGHALVGVDHADQEEEFFGFGGVHVVDAEVREPRGHFFVHMSDATADLAHLSDGGIGL